MSRPSDDIALSEQTQLAVVELIECILADIKVRRESREYSRDLVRYWQSEWTRRSWSLSSISRRDAQTRG